MKKCCLNCAYRNEYEGYNKKYKIVPHIRCWHEPRVCDHPFVIEQSEAGNNICENYITEEEKQKLDKDKAWTDYLSHLKAIENILDKYPEFEEESGRKNKKE